MESANVDISFTPEILQSTVERFQWRTGGWNGWRNSRLFVQEGMDLRGDAATLRSLDHRHTVLRHHVGRRWRTVRVEATRRTVDDGNPRLIGVAGVRGCSRSVILVGGDGVTARSNQCWDVSSRMAEGPTLGGWTVVMLLWVAVVEVLGCHWAVQARRLLMVAGRVSMSSGIHEVAVSTPQCTWKSGVERETSILRCSSCHVRALAWGKV